MGVYKTLKPLKRHVGGDHITIPPGEIVTLELRSEARAALEAGAVTRNLRAVITDAPKTERTRPQAPPYGLEQEAEMSELGKAIGKDFATVWAKVKSLMQGGLDFGGAVHAIRKRHGLLTAEELIDDYADEIGADATEVQEDLHICAEQYGLGMGEVISRDRVAREVGMDLADVCERVAELTAHGVHTPDEAFRIVGDEALALAADTHEIGDREFVENVTRVRVSEDDPDWPGREGTVVNVTGGGRVWVDIDGDKAKYRKFAPEALIIID